MEVTYYHLGLGGSCKTVGCGDLSRGQQSVLGFELLGVLVAQAVDPESVGEVFGYYFTDSLTLIAGA